jgi:hypothetical protein
MPVALGASTSFLLPGASLWMRLGIAGVYGLLMTAVLVGITLTAGCLIAGLCL